MRTRGWEKLPVETDFPEEEQNVKHFSRALILHQYKQKYKYHLVMRVYVCVATMS